MSLQIEKGSLYVSRITRSEESFTNTSDGRSLIHNQNISIEEMDHAIHWVKN